MWLGTIMWFNVWFIIWPNQQKALNIGGKYPNLAAAEKAAAGKIAGQFSRINTLAVHSHAVLHGGGGASLLRCDKSRWGTARSDRAVLF